MLLRIVSAILAFIMSFFSLIFGGGDKSVLKNVAYGSSSEQKLDLYLPANPGDEPIGLMLFIHGGAWIGGSREELSGMCEAIHQSGMPIAAATVDYRLMSEKNAISCTEMLDDICAALATIDTIAHNRGISIDRVGFAGFSAGGHLALMQAYSRADRSTFDVKFVLSMVGPTDLSAPGLLSEADEEYKYTLLSHLAGDEITAANAAEKAAGIAAVSPITYATAASVPTILAYGGKDVLVPLSNGADLDAKLTQLGVTHVYIPFPNSGHGLENDSDASALLSDTYYAYLVEYLQ